MAHAPHPSLTSLFDGENIQLFSLGNQTIELQVNLKKESVNKFNQATLADLSKALDHVPSDTKGMLICSGKETFLAGADITEFLDHFKKPEAQLAEWISHGQKLFNRIEDFSFPVVTLVSGFALGGGLEFALSADYHLVSPETKLGLPETKLGIIPGWGGTVRLPRLIGLDPALEAISSGNQFDAQSALKLGIVDGVVAKEKLKEEGYTLLSNLIANKLPWKNKKEIKKGPLKIQGTEKAMALTIQKGGILGLIGPNYPAPMCAFQAIEASLGLSRDEALRNEALQFAKAAKTTQAAAMVGNFLADQNAKRKAKSYKGKAKTFEKAAVLGAGIMGGGIAYQSAISKMPIFMKDIRPEALLGGMKEATQLLVKQIEKGKATPASMAETLSRIQPTIKNEDLSQAQFVIEAVTEKEDIKTKVLQEMETILPESAYVTSNTSTISITSLQSKLKRPERFCGMHFFNPVPKMPLVEVIRGKQTSEETIATAVQYATQMGKTAIVVNDCPGFLVNRVLFAYFTAFNELISEGVDFAQIDKAMEKWGWPMGPGFLMDVIGVDTAFHASKVMEKGFPDRMTLKDNHSVVKLFHANRFGQKNQKGFYAHSVDAKGKPKKELNPEIYGILGQDGKSFKSITHDEIIERLMMPFIVESARCLHEKIAEDAFDLDLAMLTGLGFPPFRGGPIRYAQSLGIESLKSISEKYKSHGPLYSLSNELISTIEGAFHV